MTQESDFFFFCRSLRVLFVSLSPFLRAFFTDFFLHVGLSFFFSPLHDGNISNRADRMEEIEKKTEPKKTATH